MTDCDRSEETKLLRILHASNMSDNVMDVDVSEEKKDTETVDTAGNAEVPVDRSSNEPSTGGAKQEKQMPWQRPPMDLYATQQTIKTLYR